MAHIAKKGNRYYVVVYGGINRSTGRDMRDWSDGFATRKEAERAAAEIVEAQAGRRLPVTGSHHARRLPQRSVAAAQEVAAESVDVRVVPEQRPAARRTEDRIDPAPTAPARGPRHVVRRAARRREAQRCRRRARTEVGSEHPRDAPQGARRRPSQGHRAPQRRRPRRPAEGAHRSEGPSGVVGRRASRLPREHRGLRVVRSDLPDGEHRHATRRATRTDLAQRRPRRRPASSSTSNCSPSGTKPRSVRRRHRRAGERSTSTRGPSPCCGRGDGCSSNSR